MKMINRISVIAATVLVCQTLSAQEPVRWLRRNAISPDGNTIAFVYQGDIFTVSVNGGNARQITSAASFETNPVWTRDGRQIVFSSYREGSKDIYITSAEGGTPKRLTTYQGDETPLAVLGDGTILFSSDILPDTEYSEFPGYPQLYKIGLEGGKPELVTSLTMSNISVSGDGTVLYEDYKGYEDDMRKHHTSSVTRDIWLYQGSGDAFSINADGIFKKLSTFKGEDRNPVFGPDGNSFFYLSERGGNFNVWKSSVSNPSSASQVTALPTHPVRYLSIADNGTMVFSYNGDLYRFNEGSEPVKLEIRVSKDKSLKDVIRRTVSSGTTDLAISPNGKEVAVVARGDIFVTSIDYRTTKRITCTPEKESGASFSKDGRELYYAAERNGCWSIWKTSLTEKDDKYFTYSYKFKEEMVTKPGVTCTSPSVSPDGKYLAYFKDRTDIVVRDLKSGEEKTVLKEALYSYKDGDLVFSWSPDSHYILTDYEADGGWNNPDVALIDVETGKVTDLTESGYSDTGFKWALGGKAMTWESDKAGYRSHGSWGAEGDVYIMFFDGKAYYEFTKEKELEDLEKLLKEDDKKAAKQEAKDSIKAEKGKIEKLELDLENRADRIIRLTSVSGRLGDHFLTNDGTKLYYIQRLEKSNDLCLLDIKAKSIKVLERSVTGKFYPDNDGKYIYLMSGLSLKRIDAATGSGKSITYTDDYDYFPDAERQYILAHTWNLVKDKFYDETIHGIDWDGFYENYKQFLPYIDNGYDYQELLSEFLGELNASHTGGRYRVLGSVSTGRLGLIYDDSYHGNGLKIKEILPGSCVALVKNDLKAGDIITAVDGAEIKADANWYDILNYKSGKRVLLTINDGKKEEDIFVTTGSSDQTLLYKKWIRSKEKLVEKLSGGRIGYVHVESMDSESFRELYSKALGKYRSCDAIIVDTRHNGGGWLHDDLATFLSGKAYIDFMPRGQYIGTEPYNKWNKLSCVVVGEDNYSDASGFPYIYKQLGIGKLVGAPVPGTMSAVWWETQIDPTITIGVPEVTSVSRKDGSILENQEIEPDILVYNDPASLLRGEDKQIEAAVAELLKQIENK